ncbi:HNH endonuclease [Lactococcus phage 38507]|uniref:HNH endonuclease n=1 Tax=Lactococcus phage 38507 TaxID=2029663 RepID=A0A343JPD3_9CAUD|nr:HNH endonuclease [Lactococcus phage 38507]ASZ71356.1 HNH endonuclease [Lactococcus phage 38507]
METINIKFDEKQLEEVVKKITEELKKEKANFYELSDTKHEELKKWSLMYLEFNEVDDTSNKGKLYFGHLFNTLSKECASDFDFSEYGREQVEKLKSQGWKEEVVLNERI